MEVKRGDNGTFKCKCGKTFELPGSIRRHARSCGEQSERLEIDGEDDMQLDGRDSMRWSL